MPFLKFKIAALYFVSCQNLELFLSRFRIENVGSSDTNSAKYNEFD